MSILDHFSLPYKGLKDGVHKYKFVADDTYFGCFENSPVSGGKIKVDLNLEKRSNSSILDFEIDGYVDTGCDRCLADIKLPINGYYTMHVKITSEEVQDVGDDIIYLHAEEPKLDLSQVIYEMIVLSIPMIKAYDCQNEKPLPCNTDILEKLGSINELEVDEVEETKNIWGDLRNLRLDEN
jgi:uncharacterized protein